MTKFWAFLTNHTHYWSAAIYDGADKKVKQHCYGCGKSREVAVLAANVSRAF